MKYIDVKTVVESYKGFQDSMTNKSWGYLALLKGCNESIRPLVPYEVNIDVVSNFLEGIFNLSQTKRKYENGRSLYVVFSNKWEHYFNDQGRHTPNIYDVAVWAYRRKAFPDDITEEEVIGDFAKEFNIPFAIIKDSFDTQHKSISFNKVLYSEQILKLELGRIGVDVSRDNIDAKKGSVVASPGEITRGPFVQTLYAGLEITDYVLILQSNYDTLYGSKIVSSSSPQTITLTNNSSFLPFVTAIRTKPFLLLAGISGTGKSRIVRKLAQMTVTEELQKKYDKYSGTDFENDIWNLHTPANFKLIQVKPNWHNSMDVVGYLTNIPEPHYVFTPFVEFIARAWQHQDIPFFLCLDEMNLAPVEEYFAEFLSAIESRAFENHNGENVYVTDPIIKPFDSFGPTCSGELMRYIREDLKIDFPLSFENELRQKGLTLPKNLIVIGTVNMDETTYSFSRKVLDRAMSFEMNDVDYAKFLEGTTDDELKSIREELKENLNELLTDRHIEAKEIISQLGKDAEFVVTYLGKVNKLLAGTPFKLGYRAANEAMLYVMAARETRLGDAFTAMNDFTLMKILSRFEGDSAKMRIDPKDKRLKELGYSPDDVKDKRPESVDRDTITILSCMHKIIEDMLMPVTAKTETEVEAPSLFAEEDETKVEATEQENKQLTSLIKLESMMDQLNRERFVSYWN